MKSIFIIIFCIISISSIIIIKTVNNLYNNSNNKDKNKGYITFKKYYY